MALTKLNYTGQGTIPSASLPTIPISKIPTITSAKMPSDSVLQVIYASYNTQKSSPSSTFADTGLTATIIPTSASSKILVSVQQNGVYKSGGNTTGVGIKILRDSTDLGLIASRAGGDVANVDNSIGTVGGDIYDSPNTTSATVYKSQYAATSNTGSAWVQIYNVVSTITLMEIKG